MRLFLIAALFAATSTMAGAEIMDFDEWFVANDSKKCILTYEDANHMIDIITEKGGIARFATEPSTTGDLFQSFDGEVRLAGKSQGFRKG